MHRVHPMAIRQTRSAGLGFLMLSAMSKMNTPLVFAGLLGACALAALLSGLVAGIGQILARRHFE